jgi:hypothetical protein
MESKQLRDRLNRKLPTDAEFSAFIIDSFPGVGRNLTDGMNRTQKLNLLLETHDLHLISMALERYITRIRIYNFLMIFVAVAMCGLVTKLLPSSGPTPLPPERPLDLSSPLRPAPPPDLRMESQDFETITIEGQDPCGRKATFRMRIEVSASTWIFGQTDAVEFGKKPERYPSALMWVAERIPSEHANRVICVGTASEEGSNDSEGVRSAWRAKQLQRWLEEIWKGKRPRYTLNMGRYQPKDKNAYSGPETAENARKLQRSVIFIEILDRAKNVNLAAALKDGMKKGYQRQELNYNIDNYSEFTLEPNEGTSELDCPPKE